jgi:hypothetical protein
VNNFEFFYDNNNLKYIKILTFIVKKSLANIYLLLALNEILPIDSTISLKKFLLTWLFLSVKLVA